VTPVARTVGSDAEATRARILDTARELFVEHGYAGTSVRDIAERLGLTKGSLYYHFTAKDEVLFALLTPLMSAIDAFILTAGRVAGLTEDLVGRLVNLFDEHGPLVRSLVGDPTIKHSLLSHQEVPARILALHQVLAGGTPAGAPAGPDALLRGRCALGVINAAILTPWNGKAGVPAPRHRLSEEQKRFVTRAVLAVLSIPDPVMRAPGAVC
jgi:AcrR family transcriptional regulator